MPIQYSIIHTRSRPNSDVHAFRRATPSLLMNGCALADWPLVIGAAVHLRSKMCGGYLFLDHVCLRSMLVWHAFREACCQKRLSMGICSQRAGKNSTQLSYSLKSSAIAMAVLLLYGCHMNFVHLFITSYNPADIYGLIYVVIAKTMMTCFCYLSQG